VAALLISTHSSPLYDPWLLSELGEYTGVSGGSEGKGRGDLCGVTTSSLAGLRSGATALLTQFVEGAPAAGKEALAANPHEKSAETTAAAAAASSAMDVDVNDARVGESLAPLGRGQAWLEGVMMTVIQLAKHGDAAHVAAHIALLLPAVLRVQEPPDRDFALVAKRTLTYLKYIVFPRDTLGVVVAGLLEGLRDPQWHARAASLKFTQAFAFRHAFILTADEMAALRDEVIARLTDSQIEVRLLAGDTLIGFLKGVGAVALSAETLRGRCLAAAAPPPRKKRRAAAATAVIAVAAPGAAPGAAGAGGGVALEAGAETGAGSEMLRRHGAVLGASACVLSSPYDVPMWMPEMLEALARWAGEPSPVKETVQRTFSEFKKTHQDTWQQTKAAFTTEQWDNISVGMELAPSYIS
jgi:proteasome activator subunit 4